MMAFCPVSNGSGLTDLDGSIFFVDLAVLILLASPMVIIFVLWRIFVPPRDLPAANMLGLDPEADIGNRARFCWSGIPSWKLALYGVLTVMTLIY
jgi:hypothetical protein